MALQTSQKLPGTVEVTAQGRLLTVTPITGVKSKITRGDRQSSNEFTKSSRLNLLRTFSKIKAPNDKGFRSRVSMVTLTMKKIVHARTAKEYLFTFLKRWRRKYPTLSGIWKLEFQKRGAPHFHLILYNAGYISKDSIRDSWGHVIGQDKPFTRIERITNYRQGMAYVAKYLGKVETPGFNYGSNLTVSSGDDSARSQSIGRRWGIFNRDWIPFAEKTTETIPHDGSWWLIRRYCSRFWSALEEDDTNGYSVFVDNADECMIHILTLSHNFTYARPSI